MTASSKKPHPADLPDSVGWTLAQRVVLATANAPFRLESGVDIGPVEVEYECYGELSAARDNVVVIAHALSGDAHVAGWDRCAMEEGRPWRAKKPGWWDSVVGPGKPIDTNRFFVLCSNYLGGCYGSTGPASTDPASGKPYGLRFPGVTVGDWVRLQTYLLDYLGIERAYAVIGGSLGGQQTIEWALAYPDRVENIICLAASARLSSQGLAFNAVGRSAIIRDPNFNNGDYYDGPVPDAGLALARMMAHITYLSEEGMHAKFGRRLQGAERPDFSIYPEFAVESYLDYQGRAFVERFDANSYLYITRAMDYYDAAEKWGSGDLTAACERIRSRVMVVSFSSDWLYTPAHCREFALAVMRNGHPSTYVEVPSQYGHDAFLVETDVVGRLLRSFLNGWRR